MPGTLHIYVSAIDWLERHQLPCLLKKIFGFDCPGCGIQRSAVSLLRGDFKQAFIFYPALPLILILFLYLLLRPKNESRFSTKITQGGTALIFLVILASYITKLTT